MSLNITQKDLSYHALAQKHKLDWRNKLLNQVFAKGLQNPQLVLDDIIRWIEAEIKDKPLLNWICGERRSLAESLDWIHLNGALLSLLLQVTAPYNDDRFEGVLNANYQYVAVNVRRTVGTILGMLAESAPLIMFFTWHRVGSWTDQASHTVNSLELSTENLLHVLYGQQWREIVAREWPEAKLMQPAECGAECWRRILLSKSLEVHRRLEMVAPAELTPDWFRVGRFYDDHIDLYEKASFSTLPTRVSIRLTHDPSPLPTNPGIPPSVRAPPILQGLVDALVADGNTVIAGDSDSVCFRPRPRATPEESDMTFCEHCLNRELDDKAGKPHLDLRITPECAGCRDWFDADNQEAMRIRMMEKALGVPRMPFDLYSLTGLSCLNGAARFGIKPKEIHEMYTAHQAARDRSTALDEKNQEEKKPKDETPPPPAPESTNISSGQPQLDRPSVGIIHVVSLAQFPRLPKDF